MHCVVTHVLNMEINVLPINGTASEAHSKNNEYHWSTGN